MMCIYIYIYIIYIECVHMSMDPYICIFLYNLYEHAYLCEKKTYNLLEALWISVGASQICRFFLVVQERAL